MVNDYTRNARHLGIISSTANAVLIAAYAFTLILGFLSLTSPEKPIGDPFFTILEVLIIVMMPVMVVLMVAVHAWAPIRVKTLSFTAVVFMGLLCVITCSIHFVILCIRNQPSFSGQSWLPLFIEFKWPSVVYALDILGWDIFFPLSMLFAAMVFSGNRLALLLRLMMIISGVLALSGLSGVLFGNMELRNIGIVGYVGVFFVINVLLAILFYREVPQEA